MLSHIDVQAEVGESYPGNGRHDVPEPRRHRRLQQDLRHHDREDPEIREVQEGERYGLYFETGQGSEFTNGAANGVDMMVLESRKYGFSRAVGAELAKVQPRGAWLHVNDVAGFIGPEVFKTREQLVRCCLEDIAMGKLHGLTIGLDICTTLHMTVSLDDLDWCQDQIMPANPVYLIALPTKNDPMLGYLTTSFQDHVRLREKFGFKVNDAMWDFYKRIGIVDQNDAYTEQLWRPALGLLPVPAGQGRRRAPRTRSTRKAGKKMKEVEAERRRPRDRSRREDLGPQSRSSRPRSMSLYDDAKHVPLGRAHARVHRLHPRCRAAFAPCPRTATTTSPIRPPAKR